MEGNEEVESQDELKIYMLSIQHSDGHLMAIRKQNTVLHSLQSSGNKHLSEVVNDFRNHNECQVSLFGIAAKKLFSHNGPLYNMLQSSQASKIKFLIKCLTK